MSPETPTDRELIQERFVKKGEAVIQANLEAFDKGITFAREQCQPGGLHIGQGDLPVAEARRILKPGQILGRSNHLVEEVVESQALGADHVALGATYPTDTKVSIRSRAPTGLQRLTEAKVLLDVPLVAIGGINEHNLEAVVRAGADAICVSSAVGLAPDPEGASRRLVEGIRAAGGKA